MGCIVPGGGIWEGRRGGGVGFFFSSDFKVKDGKGQDGTEMGKKGITDIWATNARREQR